MPTPQVLHKALNFLESLSYSEITTAAEYTAADCAHVHRNVDVVFPAAFVLHALSLVPETELGGGLRVLSSELITKLQQEALGFSYNYWTRESALQETHRLPDDLDDTACVASALLVHGVKPADETFFKTVRIEHKVGGPYKTWYVDKAADVQKRWQDVDPVVNAHFYYLSCLYELELPKLRQYLIDCCTQKQTKSQYYPEDLMFYLYLGRALQARPDSQLERHLIAGWQQYQPTAQSTPIATLLWAVIASYLHKEISPQLWAQICSWQQLDGGVMAMPLCFGFPISPTEPTFCGNRAAATALFAELLAKQLPGYATRPTSQPTDAVDSRPLPKWEADYQNLWATVTEEIAMIGWADIPEYVSEKPYRSLTLPLAVLDALGIHPTAKQREHIKHLSLALFYGWVGFNVLDSTLDGQTPKQLGNDSGRWWQLMYNHINSLPTAVRGRLIAALNATHAYYIWEQTYLRFPAGEFDKFTPPGSANYGYIAERMCGFTVGLASVLDIVDTPSQQGTLIWLFEVILTLEQLSDDLRDWEEDFKHGTCNYLLWVAHHKYVQNPTTNLSQLVLKESLPEVLKATRDLYHQGIEASTALGGDVFFHELVDKYHQPFVELEKRIKQLQEIPHQTTRERPD